MGALGGPEAAFSETLRVPGAVWSDPWIPRRFKYLCDALGVVFGDLRSSWGVFGVAFWGLWEVPEAAFWGTLRAAEAVWGDPCIPRCFVDGSGAFSGKFREIPGSQRGSPKPCRNESKSQ